MASSFLGLYVQRDALMIAQKALDITGNNISNIDTPGYSRQRVDIVSIANSNGTLGYNTAVSLAGKGAQVMGIAQVRSRIYDLQVRNYSGDLCDVGVKLSTLGDIEDIFDSIEADSSDVEASFAAMVYKLKAALQGYTADNADRAEMANITKDTAQNLEEAIRTYALDLQKVSEDTISDTQTTLKRINDIFAEMGRLNEQIKDSYISMNNIKSANGNYSVQSDYGPLELKDKMNYLLDELAQYGNIEYKEEMDGTFSVKFANQLVVSEKYYAQMAATEENPRPTELSFIISQTDMKDAWSPVTDERGKPLSGLYSKQDWYEMNVKSNTGGDPMILVRNGEAGKTIDITGLNHNELPYLSSGSLRGLLDMYNGKGITFTAEPKDAALKQQAEIANKALEALAKGFSASPKIPDNERDELIQTLKDSIGATVKTDENGDIESVKIGNTVIMERSEDADGNEILAFKTLSVGNPDEPQDLDNLTVYASDKPAAMAENVTKVNDLLKQLAADISAGKEISSSDFEEIAAALASVGGTITKDKNGKYNVTVGGVSVLEEKDGVTTAKEISAIPNEGNNSYNMQAGGEDAGEFKGEKARTIAVNDYQGIEYYRDMLNSYVRTMCEAFNNVYAGIDDYTHGEHTLNITIPGADGAEDTVITLFDGKEVTGTAAADGATVTVNGQVIKTCADEAEASALADEINSKLEELAAKTNGGKTLTKEEAEKFADFFKSSTDEGISADFETSDIILFECGDDFRKAAENFRLSDTWRDNPDIVANPYGQNEYEELDNTYIHKLLALFSNPLTYSDGMGHTLSQERTLDKFVSYMNEEVGTQRSGVNGVYELTDIQLTGVETSRSEVMDVSLNEEGVNMMNYQKWYNAISRMISTLDEALDKLINNTGLVGLR